MYLYNKSTNIVDLPTGETLYPGCLSAYIGATANQMPGMQALYQSGLVTVLDTPNLFEAIGYRVKMCFLGNINMSYDFPDRMLVQDGVVMTILSNVSDINPEKTNTGQSFAAGQTIIWYRGQWVQLSLCDVLPDYYHWAAAFSCETHSWGITLVSVDKIGPESGWEGEGYNLTCTTMSAATPEAPGFTPLCPESIDVYQKCISGVTADVFEECPDTPDLADVYEECVPVPPTVLADVYELCPV